MRSIAAVVALGVAFGALFLSYPELDIIVARQFYLAPHNFTLSDTPIGAFFSRGIEILMLVTGVLLLAALAVVAIRRRPLLGLNARTLVYLILSYAIGPGLVVNLILKNHWGRARPIDISAFGGQSRFSPALLISDQCDHNCAFVSGDASVAFAFLAFALILPRWRIPAIAGALLFGAGIGAIRMMQGAHFISDVIFAGIFTALVVLVLKYVLLKRSHGPAGGHADWRPWRRRSLS
jgi:lipid A 4'-phosphatase